MKPQRDDDVSSQCSDSSFDPDYIARAFAKNFAQVEPTERNPSMYSKPHQRPSMLERLSGAGRRTSNSGDARRKSLFGREESATKARHSSKKRLSTFTARIKAYLKKEVKFEKKANVRFMETVEELDVAAIWFTEEEMRNFKYDAQDIADALDAGMRDENECYRGLEAKTEDGNWNAYKARKDVTNAVLDEQDRQLEDCAVEDLDLDEIAKVCLEISEGYLAEAQERAKQDALDAELLLMDTKKEYETWKELQKAKVVKAPLLVEEDTAATSELDGDNASADDSIKRPLSAHRLTRGKKKQRQGSKTDKVILPEAPPTPSTPRASRKSWFVRATQKFDQSGNTQMLPGVGMTTVKVR